MGFRGKFLFDSEEKKVELTEKFYKDSNIEIKQEFNSKFYNDKLFFKNKNKVFLLDGVILNNYELIEEYDSKTWKETFVKLYEKEKFGFLNKLRGSFCGVIYDIENKKLILFTDQLKSKSIFYSLKEKEIIFSTSLPQIAALNKKENVLDEDAAYLLLTFGGTLEERTLFKNIRKLNFATFLEIDLSKKIEKKQYWMFNNEEDLSITEEKAIKKIDELFRKAIKREYDKDLEYGYSHLVELSAGRDSRMNTWVAHEMGYQDNVLNMTFSETDELDEKIPKQIAKDLKHEWIFKSLDNGNCVYYIEEVMKLSCGEVHYGSLCHSNLIMRNLNCDKFGILHTGQIGDGVIGYYGNNKKKLKNSNLKTCGYINSKKLLNKVIEKNIIKNYYCNEEIFNHINRGIYVTSESSIMYLDLQIISPFLDLDLIEYCLKIPYKIRHGNSLYDRWILKKYKSAGKYSHNGRKIGSQDIKILGKIVPVAQLIPKVLKKLKIIKGNLGMNPFDSWYNTNVKLKEVIDNYYEKNKNRLEKNIDLKKDAEYLYQKGNMIEKLQVISLLATLKLYFDQKD